MVLGDYFSALFATIRTSPGLFFGAALIFGSIAAIATASGEFFMLQIFQGNMFDPYANFDQVLPGTFFGAFGSAAIAQVVLVIGQTFNWGIYSIMIGRGAVGLSTSLGQGFRLLRGQWGKLVGLMVLGLLAMVAFGLIIALLMFLVVAVAFSGSEPDTGLAIGLTVLAMLLAFVAPAVTAIFLTVRWHLVIPAIVVEDRGIFDGLRRSWQLTRGYFWRTLGIWLLFSLILGIVSAVITSPLVFISSFVLLSAGTEGELLGSMLVLNLLLNAIGSLVSFVVTNMGVLISIFFYYDYRFRKEGLGLHFQQIAAQVGGATPTDRFDTSGHTIGNTGDIAQDLIPGRQVPGA